MTLKTVSLEAALPSSRYVSAMYATIASPQECTASMHMVSEQG